MDFEDPGGRDVVKGSAHLIDPSFIPILQYLTNKINVCRDTLLNVECLPRDHWIHLNSSRAIKHSPLLRPCDAQPLSGTELSVVV